VSKPNHGDDYYAPDTFNPNVNNTDDQREMQEKDEMNEMILQHAAKLFPTINQPLSPLKQIDQMAIDALLTRLEKRFLQQKED
jgi:hypothetical protein